MTILGAQSLPSIGIPFPRKISGAQFPSKYGFSDASLYSDGPDTPTSIADTKCGSPSPPKQPPLRWLSASTTPSTPVTIPSFSSTTTDGSALHLSESFVRGGNATFAYKELSYHSPIQEERMGITVSKQGRTSSVFQFFSKSHPRKKGTKPRPLYSESSPTLSTFADIFPPNGALPESSSGLEYGPVMSPASSARSVPLYVTTDFNGIAAQMKSHGRHVSQISQRLRGKSSTPVLNQTHQPSLDAGANSLLPDLSLSQDLQVFDKDGVAVRFGDLWKSQRTCVIFIRHFWCPQCMDYTRSIVKHVNPDVLRRVGVRLVLISSGSSATIKSYQSIFMFPFQIYTDPSLAVYHALGMTSHTIDGSPQTEQGQYIEQGIAAGVAMFLKNAVNTRMPPHKSGGDTKQLGGEFVLGPGLRCSFWSRLCDTRSHTPISDVIAAAGIHMRSDLDTVPNPPPRISSDEDRWMREREAELRRMRARKVLRRGFTRDSRSSEADEL